MDGRIPLGEPLRERQLAEELDISRAPIREALLTLEKEGLVVTTPHKGTFVASYSDEDVIEIYTLRAALEELAVTRLGGHVTAADLRALDDLVIQMDRYAAAGEFRSLIQQTRRSTAASACSQDIAAYSRRGMTSRNRFSRSTRSPMYRAS